ncbi:hypothetical protein V4Y02_23980, partial [Escherichia coli]
MSKKITLQRAMCRRMGATAQASFRKGTGEQVSREEMGIRSPRGSSWLQNGEKEGVKMKIRQ